MQDELPPPLARLWYVREDEVSPAQLAAYVALLSPEERAKHQRYHFQADRDRFAIARGMTRVALSRAAPADPASWRFVENRYGKPAVAAPALSWLRFNVSHTRGMVALLLANGREVGVDVEAAREIRDYPGIARHSFSPVEANHVLSRAGEERAALFLRYWTLKESYIKARGMGLSLPLEKFSFHFSPSGDISLSLHPELQDDPARWRHTLRYPSPNITLATTIEARPDEPLSLDVIHGLP